MAVKKIAEIPDELFEREIFLELDSSKVQQQKYIGVSVLTQDDLINLDPGYEKISISYKEFRGPDDMFDKGFFTREEQNEIADNNYGLIDKCVSEFMPQTVEQKSRYSADDIRDVCHEAFSNALNRYPRNESTAKFSSFAYVCMSNACRDFIKEKYAKKRGSFISLNDPVKGGKDDGDDNTLADVIAGEEDPAYEDLEKKEAIQSFIQSVFEGMELKDVAILKYLYGIGDAEYEHTELEISELTHAPLKVVRRYIRQAEENFKLALYERGLLAEAEDILSNYFEFSEQRIERSLKKAKEKYLKSLSSFDGFI